MGGNTNSMMTKANHAYKSKKESDALKIYQSVLKENPTNLEALCMSSYLCSREGARQSNKNTRNSYYKAANTYANAALKVNPHSGKSNYVKALALGRIALISSAKEKVAASRNIKKYAERAIKYSPKHAGAWHILGRWNYGVATLNMAEKAAAKALYGGLPEGSIANAIRYYKKSMSLDPDYLINYLELGRAYKQAGQISNAKKILKQGMNRPAVLEGDDAIRSKCTALYKSL